MKGAFILATTVLLACLHEKILQIQQRLFCSVHIDKRRCNSGLAAATGTADLMDVVFDLLWHTEDDDVLDIVEVETFGCNARRHHHVFFPAFK